MCPSIVSRYPSLSNWGWKVDERRKTHTFRVVNEMGPFPPFVPQRMPRDFLVPSFLHETDCQTPQPRPSTPGLRVLPVPMERRRRAVQHYRIPVRQHISVGCGWEASGQPCNSRNYGTFPFPFPPSSPPSDGSSWAGYRGMPARRILSTYIHSPSMNYRRGLPPVTDTSRFTNSYLPMYRHGWFGYGWLA